jgi:hypothetical protein
MCLIVSIVMLIMALQNLYYQQWSIGVLQFVIALGFGFMLWRNIRLTQCERSGNCDSCALPQWITKYFTKRDD